MKLPRTGQLPCACPVRGCCTQEVESGAAEVNISGRKTATYRSNLFSVSLAPPPYIMRHVVSDRWVARCLGPFLVETCALVEAGVGLEQLDKVMRSYGLPVGPITLADEVRWRCFEHFSNRSDGGVGGDAGGGGGGVAVVVDVGCGSGDGAMLAAVVMV